MTSPIPSLTPGKSTHPCNDNLQKGRKMRSVVMTQNNWSGMSTTLTPSLSNTLQGFHCVEQLCLRHKLESRNRVLENEKGDVIPRLQEYENTQMESKDVYPPSTSFCRQRTYLLNGNVRGKGTRPGLQVSRPPSLLLYHFFKIKPDSLSFIQRTLKCT